MDMPINERRQIENEMIFRRANEVVGTDLDEIDAHHRKDGNPGLVRNDDILLRFKCECSDENCEARIPLELNVYQKVHQNRDTFIVKHNHQVDTIEKLLYSEPNYSVVKKNNSTPEPDDELKKTSINN